jgi:sugar phosphate permease
MPAIQVMAGIFSADLMPDTYNRMTAYFGELRSHWRPLTAAIIGLSAGLMMTSDVVGIMGPHLIEEFGWSKSQFALIGALALGAVLVFPLVGRLTDLIGVRKTALIGAIASPLLSPALSRIEDIQTYAILFALQASVLATTTPPVYCRIIVQYIKRARGLALATHDKHESVPATAPA